MDIATIIRTYRTVAVVGLSPDPDQPSYRNSNFLNTVGFNIVPVNPDIEEVLGEKAYPSLAEIPFPVDIVNVYHPSDSVLPIAREAVEIGAKVLWLEEGATDSEAEELCKEAGLEVVMDRSLLSEYRRLLGQVMAGRPG